MHGYQVMQELGERSGGRWRPSAGSVYPTLQQLEDEGLVTVEDRDGRRTFALTDAGRTAAAAIPADRPWARRERGDDLGGLARELGIAAIQVAGSGPRPPRTAARTILTDARRSLYRLLAEDDVDDRLSRRRSDGSGHPTRHWSSRDAGARKTRNRTTKLTISVTAKAIIAM